MKRQILDSLLLSLLLIFVISFPVNYFVTDAFSYYLIEIGLRLILLLYYYFSLRRRNQSIVGFENWKEIAILSPIFLICFSNYFVGFFCPNSFVMPPIKDKIFYLALLLDVLTAIVEEIVFRFYFHNALRISNRLVRIIASAGIFAGFHLLNLFNGFDPFIFIQVGYTFGLGIVLGFLMEYGHSLVMCVLLHGLYNMVNGTLFDYTFIGSDDKSIIIYFVVNAVITVGIAIYLLIIFLVRYRKQNRLYFY